ncbi:hypothetical protein BU24DRAFT_415567 [Aaosphaeria arxii CBS 175.79]|uniref:Thioesterase/thiol ester dehydrase-isomerase n=1 Tax=Aaosphaeria arxii CBS 175.79 TaxID=1450172 RepID=A0A6A5X7D2_9PLEO|nr:uncharacterized protein BU24DRAFT_415567 [Aaosphaeria arxii CBS 175.79]KAF2008829.1 hypothetical protein BU24DRAFT_415567 [Aaosphaeria arxii CBS 175.79]
MEAIASSGITISLTPVQAVIGAALGRLFKQIARHLLFGRAKLTVKSAKHGGEALFAPVVTSSYTPLLDIDYNVHKSNSTFFTDLDENRTELMLALFKDVVRPLKTGKDAPKPKMFNMGGTSCIFKKAIAPFARYEISSRVLCWDEKWVYVVSHFTKPGSNKPTEYLLGPKNTKKSTSSEQQAKVDDQQDRIYATAITKFVFKQGRKTCSPESVMLESGLLPTPPTTEGASGLENGVANVKKERDPHWSWEEVQAECNKHLEVAQNFGSLDKLHGTFIGKAGPAMYAY